MINVQTLGMLLRTLQAGETPGRGALPLQPLAPAQAVKAISPEGAQSQPPGAFDAGRGEPGKGDSHEPGAHSASRSSSAPRLQAVSGGPAAARPGGLPSGATLPQPSADASAVVTLGRIVSADPMLRSPAGQATTSSAATAPSASPATVAAPAATASALAATAPAGASLSLSPTAQLVDALLRLPGGRPIVPTAPLVPAPGVAPEVLARALQHSIVGSGLFYESHLARWAVDRHPDAALRQEPQAAWTAPRGTAAAGSPAGTASWPVLTALPTPESDAPLAGASTPAAAMSPSPNGSGVPDAAPALVRAQLDLLETGQILWRGDLWQGQPATLEIREEDAGRDPGNPPAWHTRLAVTLPGLGAVEARVALAGTRIHVSIVAADEVRAAPLTEALPELAAALAARGLDVAPIRVDHGRAR